MATVTKLPAPQPPPDVVRIELTQEEAEQLRAVIGWTNGEVFNSLFAGLSRVTTGKYILRDHPVINTDKIQHRQN